MLDSLNGFLVSMLLAHLIHTGERKITGNMNALQIFRIFIETIGILSAIPNYLYKPRARQVLMPCTLKS